MFVLSFKVAFSAKSLPVYKGSGSRLCLVAASQDQRREECREGDNHNELDQGTVFERFHDGYWFGVHESMALVMAH